MADEDAAASLLGLLGSGGAPNPTPSTAPAPMAPTSLAAASSSMASATLPSVRYAALQGVVVRRKAGFYAFAMCRHARLGATSPARHLTTEVLKRIFEHLRSTSGLELEISRHSVHRVKGLNDYVVSNLRKFSIEVVLCYAHSRRPAEHCLWLRSSVLCEDGRAVSPCAKCTAGCEHCLLLGDTEAVAMDGTAAFHELKIGKLLLSARHGGKRFRIRIEPRDEAVRRQHPELFVLSEPFRVVTKLPPPPPLGAPQPALTVPPPTRALGTPLDKIPIQQPLSQPMLANVDAPSSFGFEG
jgi:hypothetical protein